jgi:hypothetical protein
MGADVPTTRRKELVEPKTLSASSALVFEGCEARFLAESIQKIPSVQNSAAALGTVCHAVLEWWVMSNYHRLPNTPFDVMVKQYDEAYFTLFSDKSRYDEGLEMCRRWYDRQDWTGRQVLSTEKKEPSI